MKLVDMVFGGTREILTTQSTWRQIQRETNKSFSLAYIEENNVFLDTALDMNEDEIELKSTVSYGDVKSLFLMMLSGGTLLGCVWR